MGSVENGAVLPKRVPLLKVSSLGEGRSFSRCRSRLTRLLLFEKVNYFQWIGIVAVFWFVVILFQAFLPGFVLERSGNFGVSKRLAAFRELGIFSEIGELDFGEGIRFFPSKLLLKFEKENEEESAPSGLVRRRSGLVNPLLALIIPDLSVDSRNLHMISVAVALRDIGYDMHLYVLEDGPAKSAWRSAGFPIKVLTVKEKVETAIDWLKYNCILLTSLETKFVLSPLSQEPFKSVPVVWTVDEDSLALRVRNYRDNNQTRLLHDWKQTFKRATVVVFPNHVLPLMYSAFDSGNFYVVPGSPAEAWEVHRRVSANNGHDRRLELGYSEEDFLIGILCSQFSYSGLWLELALVLQAVAPLRQEFSSASHLKVFILNGDLTDSYKSALETFSHKVGFVSGSVIHINRETDATDYLGIADVVIYGSFIEEQSFPPLLTRAMCLRKPIIAPNLAVITKHIDDGQNGYIFPKKNIAMITEILSRAVYNGQLSPAAENIGSNGEEQGKNLMVAESVEGYAYLLERLIKLPPEVASPKTAQEILLKFKKSWLWHLFEDLTPGDGRRKLGQVLDRLESQWNDSHYEASSGALAEAFSPIDWAEEKEISKQNTLKRLEDDELKDRTEQWHGTWEEVYRNAKRADRTRSDAHERDDKELERTGQPLCIYEPYFGEGAWPFLHNKSLYRGIGLSSKGRRPGGDDIDASSRLPLLVNPYYRDVLADHGAFFALANRIDRVHKNAWIGFQSWRASAQKISLSKKAERALIEAVESRKHGDTVYFWSRIDKDPRNTFKQDFWSFCDSLNAGNCRRVVSQALRTMYGVIRDVDFDTLPPMPSSDGSAWSAVNCWALPTRSFLEYVMFSRMFADALDAQLYEEHRKSGRCPLTLTKEPGCYSRVLELLVNVWAYHSGRRMVYVDPATGAMEDQHPLTQRRGVMRIRWFGFATLKSMDEDLAEESDSDRPDGPGRPWLWPLTGEVYWQGIRDRERSQRLQQKEKKKQESKDKIKRMKSRAHQKTLGKYVKPPPEDADSNSTVAAVL
ncbi:glycosyl transferase family 1 protein [Wolffia australiana]